MYRRHKRHLSGSTTLDELVENQTPREHFKIQVIIIIINILSALVKQMEAYHQVIAVFGIYRQLTSAKQSYLTLSGIVILSNFCSVETGDKIYISMTVERNEPSFHINITTYYVFKDAFCLFKRKRNICTCYND